MILNTISKEKNITKKINKLITKKSQLRNKTSINKIYKNQIIIYLIINTILFSILFYLMIKNK
jgi:hypothetical protein